LAALRVSAPGVRVAGGEMTRTFGELVAAIEADAFDVYQPDVVLAGGMLRGRAIAELALARNRWYTPHTWTNGIGLLANLHVAAGVGGGPFIEFPYDPPGWTPERRDFMLAEPIRPGPDGVLRVPAAARAASRIATVAEGGTEDVDRAVAAARRSFDDRRWSDQPPMARKRVLLRLADLVREHLEELALLEVLDVGKPIRDALNVDVPN